MNLPPARPLLIDAERLAFELSISRSQLNSLRSAHKIPPPARQTLTNRTLWRTEQIERWIEWGFPCEDEFMQREAQHDRANGRTTR